MEGGLCVLKTGIGVFDAGHVLERERDGSCGALQVLHIVSVYVYADPAAGEIACIHHFGVVRDFHGKIGAQRGDGLAGFGAGRALREGDVNGYIVALARAQKTYAAHHGADGFHVFHFADAGEDLIRPGDSFLTRGVLRHLQRQAHGVHIHRGHIAEPLGERNPAAAEQENDSQGKNDPFSAEGPADKPAVDAVKGVLALRLLLFPILFPLAQHTFCHGGNQGQGNDEARRKGVAHGEGEVGEQLPGDAVHKYDGQEHADGGEGGGRNGSGDLLCALHRRLNRRCSLGAETVDVFDHDDGVIHQHTDGYRETGEGYHVERHAGEVHQHKREYHADRDGHQGNDRGPDIPQEQKQDDDRKNRAEQKALED